MHRYGLLRQSLSLLVLLTLLIPPVPPPLATPPAEAAPSQSSALRPSPFAGAGGDATGLYRTRVTVSTPARWQRLEGLGLAILERDADGALVLADAGQMEALARLRFQPNGTDDLGLLAAAAAVQKPWLARGLGPLLARSTQLARLKALGALSAEEVGAAAAEVRQMVRSLTGEQQAGLAALAGVDDDGDGLTNTEETWWCTDPTNPDSDADGVSDGDEARALLDWLGNRRSGPPSDGAPFRGWPMASDDPAYSPACTDRDRDAVPDAAERLVLGLNPNRESTDRDKFDDGQELFGLTRWGWGSLPRAEDAGIIFAEMPSWVKAPGSHPLVAAFPVPEIDVVPSSLTVQLVTTITTDNRHEQNEQRSYSTAKTEGTSTSNADTVTWNDWEETAVATTVQLPSAQIDPAFASSSGRVRGQGLGWDYTKYGAALGIAGCVILTAGACAIPAAIAGVAIAAGDLWVNHKEREEAQAKELDKLHEQMRRLNNEMARCNPTCKDNVGKPATKKDIQEYERPVTTSQDRASGNRIQEKITEAGNPAVDQFYQMSYPIAFVPTQTTTNTSGRSRGGAQTTTHTTYEEHTVTNGQAWGTAESWGTATAADTAHAADLWFSYKVRNAGTEYARQICNLAFNLFIGDDPNPAFTYFVANDLGGNGCFQNFMPGEEHPYSSKTKNNAIPLSLEQIKAIDLGRPLRIVVEDFSYGVDELFYQDALNAGVLVAIDDGWDDGDETVDRYLIPTWGDGDTVQDVIGRYFPHETDADANVVAIWTPENLRTTPAWCQQPRRPSNDPASALWCKHVLSTADWWNIYLNNLGDGTASLQDTPARPNSTAFFRFNRDSDLDGYSDRSELRLGTNPKDPADHPKPELLAGIRNDRSADGKVVTSTLALLNTGPYDAYGVEAIMIAPDDSISITNNTVGGSGRVRAQRQVIVGSKVGIREPLQSTWTQPGHARPAVSGYYTGDTDRTYDFTVYCSSPGGCDVGSGNWSVVWIDSTQQRGEISFGATYTSPVPMGVGAFGVKLAMLSGRVYNQERFSVSATTPRDTFQYTINREPYTEPIVIVSYNDPQGNHRFIVPPEAMNLANPTDSPKAASATSLRALAAGRTLNDLKSFSGQMLKDPGVEMVTTKANSTSASTGISITSGETSSENSQLYLIVNNPTEKEVKYAHLFLEFVNISGTVALEVPMTVTLPSGPTVVPAKWDRRDLHPSEDYIVMAFLTDYQGNILATAGRPLSSFQADPKPAFAIDNNTPNWNFGNVPQGQVLHQSVTYGNTGYSDLLAHLSDTSIVARKRIDVAFINSNQVKDAAIQGNYLWLATTGGIVVHNLTGNSYLKLTSTTDPLADGYVNSVFIDAAGYKWFATASGISVLDDRGTPFDRQGHRWVTLTTADGLPGTSVSRIVADSAGRKWTGGLGGLAVLDDGGNPFNKVGYRLQTFKLGDGMACGDVAATAIDSANRKWLACKWEGARVLDDGGTPFDKSDDRWQSFTQATSDLPSDLVSAVAIDSAGRKWFGNWAYGGLSVLDDGGSPLDKTDDYWQTFQLADTGLVCNGISSILIDETDRKWIGACAGVSVLNDNGTPLNTTTVVNL